MKIEYEQEMKDIGDNEEVLNKDYLERITKIIER